jgi:Arc/MetJ-type ribon-helix-helix transcriptional regulator
MPTKGADVATEFADYAAELVKNGRYESARDVLDGAKAALAREERYRAQVADLKQAIAEGDASGIAEGDIFARVRERARLGQRVRS